MEQAISGGQNAFVTPTTECNAYKVQDVGSHISFCLRLEPKIVYAKLFTPRVSGAWHQVTWPPLWDLHQHGGTKYEGCVLPILQAGDMPIWRDVQVSARPIQANVD